jgi:Protein of unknown function (DUF3662)/FHA domain
VLTRLSKSSLRPIEIGRKLIRSIDVGRITGTGGTSTSPNAFVVHLNEKDRMAFGDLEKALIGELTDAAKQYAQDEGFALIGDVSVVLITDATVKPGKVEVHAEVRPTSGASLSESASSSLGRSATERSSEASPAAGTTVPPVSSVGVPAPVIPGPLVAPTMATPSIPSVPMPNAAPATLPPKKATLVLADGTRVAVKTGVMSVGRSAESTLPLNDTNVSRKHAEIRSRGEGDALEWLVVDLGSTNGTMLNGVKISGEKRLKNGDSLMFGSTVARFEVA